MAPFPFGTLKEETLRSICKDLGAGAETKRNRDEMVAFLEGVELGRACSKRGKNSSSSPHKLQTHRPLQTFLFENHPRSDALNLNLSRLARLPPKQQNTSTRRTIWSMSSGSLVRPSSIDQLSSPNLEFARGFEGRRTCDCQSGWFSPRSKYVLESMYYPE